MMVCSFPTTGLGGASVVANELTRCYLQAGHKVILVSISPFGSNGHAKTILDLDTIGFRPDYGKKAGIILREFLDVYNPQGLAFLKRLLQREQPDCVHFQSLHNGVSAYGPMVTRSLRIPSIVTVHELTPICALYRLDRLPGHRECSGPSPLKCLACRRHSRWQIPVPFRNHFIRGFASAADCIFTISHSARDWLVDTGFSDNKVRTIHNGVDTKRFHPDSHSHYGEKRDVFRVLYVGRVRYKKGITYLAEACATLVEQGYSLQLEIIGDVRPKLKNDSFVRFVGSVDRHTLPVYYRAADVLVQPSITYESFGLTLLEGMASGVPVIATDMGGMPEVVGECGIVVPARDAQALAQAIERLILDPGLRRRLGQEGRERAERLFTWESKAAQYLEYLRNAL